MSKGQWKKASTLKKWIKGSYFLFTTFNVSVESLLRTLFKTNRQKLDAMLKHWGVRFIKRSGARLVVNNPNKVEFKSPGKKIIMANHSSHFDIPVIYCSIDGSIRMLAKKELSKIPVFGYACKKAEMLFIDRKNRNEAIKDLEVVKQKLESGIVMCIFPEGTRSNDGNILPLKKGAIRLAIDTGATIIPVGIKGANKALPARSFDLHEGGEIEVNIGEPINASDYTMQQRDDLSGAVRNQLESLIKD